MPTFPIHATEGEVRVPGYLMTLLGVVENDQVELYIEGTYPHQKAVIRPAVERVTIGRKDG